MMLIAVEFAEDQGARQKDELPRGEIFEGANLAQKVNLFSAPAQLLLKLAVGSFFECFTRLD